jgi:iron transport multicopper oxidase
MAGCVLTALLGALLLLFASAVLTLMDVTGMLTVMWYALGGRITEEEEEHEVRAALAKKERRGKFFGLLKNRN